MFVVELRTLRACRIALGQSQAAFALMLGASPESYRTWDAGRRAAPPKMLARARACGERNAAICDVLSCAGTRARVRGTDVDEY